MYVLIIAYNQRKVRKVYPTSNNVCLQAQTILHFRSNDQTSSAPALLKGKFSSWLSLTTVSFLGVVLSRSPLLKLPEDYFKAPSDH